MTTKKRIISTKNAPAAIGPYSQAVQIGDFIFLSGQIPLTAEGELLSGSMEEQAHQVLKNMKAILAEAGLGFEHVIKTTVFIADMNEFNQLNQVYEQYFGEHRPARSCVEVARLPKDVKVEIESIVFADSQ